MTDLVEWLETAIGEREQAAELATLGPWVATSHGFVDVVPASAGGFVAIAAEVYADGSSQSLLQADAEHIALNDPAAVLRRCAADRKILAECVRWIDDGSGITSGAMLGRIVLRALAEGYGYQEVAVHD